MAKPLQQYVELSWKRRQEILAHYQIRQNIGRRRRELHRQGRISWEQAERQATEEFRSGELKLRPFRDRMIAANTGAGQNPSVWRDEVTT